MITGGREARRDKPHALMSEWMWAGEIMPDQCKKGTCHLETRFHAIALRCAHNMLGQLISALTPPQEHVHHCLSTT